jgi:hypothetical protein
MSLLYEEHVHVHDRRLTKAELMRHLKVPHRRSNGGWISLASEPRGWRLDELEREHEEFHGAADNEVKA